MLSTMYSAGIPVCIKAAKINFHGPDPKHRNTKSGLKKVNQAGDSYKLPEVGTQRRFGQPGNFPGWEEFQISMSSMP